MTSKEYLTAKTVNTSIRNFVKNSQHTQDEKKILDIKNMLVEAFNQGVMSLIGSRKALSKETKLGKSKLITKYLPDTFANDDIAKQLIESVMEAIKLNSTNYKLNIGYEELLPEDIKIIIQIAYAIGVTSAFEITDDEEMKSLYLANADRFIMHGTNGDK